MDQEKNSVGRCDSTPVCAAHGIPGDAGKIAADTSFVEVAVARGTLQVLAGQARKSDCGNGALGIPFNNSA